MNVQVHHVIVHSPEQVREIVAEAGRIADDSGTDGEQWLAVFNQASTLLGARHTLAMMPQGGPIDLGALRPGANGRR